MEILSKISVAIFDKTGTLTKGNPQVTDVIQLNETAVTIVTSIGSSSQQRNTLVGDNQAQDNLVLYIAAIAEKGFEHPLAKAIVNYARDQDIQQINDINLEKFESIPGRGIIAVYNGLTIRVGNQAFMQDQHIELSSSIQLVEKLQVEGKTTVLISVNNSIIGLNQSLVLKKQFLL